MKKLTFQQFQIAQKRPDYLEHLAERLDVSPQTVLAVIPATTIQASAWPYNDIALPRWHAVAKIIQTRAPGIVPINDATALAKHLAQRI